MQYVIADGFLRSGEQAGNSGSPVRLGHAPAVLEKNELITSCKRTRRFQCGGFLPRPQAQNCKSNPRRYPSITPREADTSDSDQPLNLRVSFWLCLEFCGALFCLVASAHLLCFRYLGTRRQPAPDPAPAKTLIRLSAGVAVLC